VKSWIRIRIKVMRIRNPAQNGATWRAVDAHNVGVEAQNGALEGL
jgi:hypothetical protein